MLWNEYDQKYFKYPDVQIRHNGNNIKVFEIEYRVRCWGDVLIL